MTCWTIVLAVCLLYMLPGGEMFRAEAQLRPAQAQYNPPPGGRSVLRFQPAAVIDFNGFEEPIAAGTLFVPHDWKIQGGVVWGQEYMCTNGYAVAWSAQSPDGLTGVALLPHTSWEGNNMGGGPTKIGCTLAPYTTVRAYLEALATRLKPGARLLAYRHRPDLLGEPPPPSPQDPYGHMQMRRWVEAGEVLFAYSERGVDMRGTLAARVVFSSLTASYGSDMPTIRSFDAYAGPAWASFAPNGQLDFRLSEAIRRTFRQNPAYEQRIARHNLEIARGARREAAKRQKMWQETQEHIARITRETWDRQQESADKRARWFGEMIRGVNTYNDTQAPGGRSEHSSSYDHVWRLRDGSYVLTNDPNFNPAVDLQVDAERLERTP